MSGYLSMSVPFLAAALAYGLSKATVLATSVLAVGQDAASSAAHEGTTGNLSLANTGYDTHRFATLEGRQIRTSAHVDTDRYTGYAPAGAAMTVTGDGTVVADAGAATSRIPAAGVRLSESLATSHEQRAAHARTLSQHWSAEAGQARNAAVTDGRAVEAHDKAVTATLAWIETNAAETRMRDPGTGSMVRAGGQKTVAAVFRHDTSRNLDPQLHSHAVLANMVKGGDGKWRTMANEKLYESKMLIGAVYRAELARGLGRLGYGVEKTHADGRFEIAGVPREVVEAFSTRRAEIEAGMLARGMGSPSENARLAERAALMSRAAKRDIDRSELRDVWRRQAEGLGFDARALAARAAAKAAQAERAGPGPEAGRDPAAEAADWAVAHLSEREAVFSRTDLLTAALSWDPGKVTAVEAEAAVGRLEDAGTLHAARLPGMDGLLTTDRAVADERETNALMAAGTGRGDRVMRARSVDKTLRKGPLTAGQNAAVRLILASEDRTVGVQGYAGSGKTTMTTLCHWVSCAVARPGVG